MRPNDITQAPLSRTTGRTLFGLFVSLMFAASQTSNAQCPWARDSSELHSDCICDFNPTETTNFDQHNPINRMSVQCSPVDFGQLLRALKQTASIELAADLEALSNNQTLAQFNSQVKLDLLHVSNSSIPSLQANTFIVERSNLTQHNNKARPLVVAIQSLHLSRCAIENIHPDAFNGLQWTLTRLSLNDNLLEWIPTTAIRQLTRLRLLDLSNNNIHRLPDNSFISLTQLNTLRLADNRFGLKGATNDTQIEPEAFKGLEGSLVDLNLKNTRLDVFPVAIKSLQNLAFLNLAQNQISNIPAGSFERIKSLTAINLERNRISRLDDDTFLGIENSLSSLSLLGNLVDVFPVKQLSRLNAIRRLDLGFNGISSLPDNAFASNNKLILVALDGNPIEILPEAAFKPLEGTLRGLSVGGKSLNCDCRLSWILRWQHQYGTQISSRERQPQFCAKPHYLRSLVSLSALKPEHLHCDGSPPSSTPIYVIATRQTNSSSKSGAWLVNSSSSETTPQLIQFSPPAEAPTLPTSHTTSVSTLLTTTQTASTTLAPMQDHPTTLSESTTEPGQPVDLTEAGTSEEITLGTDIDLLRAPTTISSQLNFINTEPTSSQPTQLLGNGLGHWPTNDELFVAEPSRKTSRHGYLPAKRHRTRPEVPEEIFRPAAQNATVSRIPTAEPVRSNRTSENPESKLRAIHSVFGTRSTSEPKRVDSRAQNTNNLSGMVPAVPTTINVYKATSQNHSGTSSSPRPTLLKGPRYMDEQPSALGTLKHMHTATTITKAKLATLDMDAVAASSVQPQRVSTQAQQSEIELSRVETTTSEPAPIGRSSANNTRMSVSSMYRLANPLRVSSSTTLMPEISMRHLRARDEIETPTGQQLEESRRFSPRKNNSQMDARWSINIPVEPIFRLNRTSVTMPTNQQSSFVAYNTPTSVESSQSVSNESSLDATTRVAATIRYVDNAQQLKTMVRPIKSNSSMVQSNDSRSVRESQVTSFSEYSIPAVVELASIQSVLKDVPVKEPSESRIQVELSEQRNRTVEVTPVNSRTSVVVDPKDHLEEQRQAKSGVPNLLVTKKDLTQPNSRQSKDEFLHESPTGVNQHRYLGKFIRLADVDQLALILAGLLCVLILTLALTIVCICYSSWSQTGSQTAIKNSRLASFSSSDTLSRNQSRESTQTESNLFSALLHPCNWPGSGVSKRGPSKRVATMRSLIIQDDENSTGEVSSSNGHKVDGKTMLLAAPLSCLQDRLHLFESIDMRAPTEQLNSETSKRHPNKELSSSRQNSRDTSEEYFMDVTRTVGHRRSLGASGRRTDKQGNTWDRDGAQSSCDSDKSCSPGANQNNRYNIGQAHRAYQANKSAHGIRASKYLTTDLAAQQRLVSTKSGLLKTIEPPADYMDGLSGFSSEKSTTDDSRAPLSSTKSSRMNHKTVNRSTKKSTNISFGISKSRSIGRLTDIQPANQRLDHYLQSSDMVPMSAEEQWPEPYVEPYEEPLEVEEHQQSPQVAPLSFVKNQIVQYRTATNYLNQQRSQNPFDQCRPKASDTTTSQRRAHRRPSSPDQAYLSNWHTMSRSSKRELSDQQQIQKTTLSRHRSIPSLAQSGPLRMQASSAAANWLRWSPGASMTASDELHSPSRWSRPTGERHNWHRDNQLDYHVSSNQQQ